MTEANTAPDMPSFVEDRRPEDAVDWPKGTIFRFFDFWCPTRSGNDETDYEQGKQHCDEAIAYARAVGDRYFLPNVMASIRKWGAVERGFLDRMAACATYGKTPAPLAEIEIEIATASGRHAEGDLRAGEEEAGQLLQIARQHNCPDTIFNHLLEIHSGRHPRGVEAQVYVIAGAALAGSSN